MLRILRYLDRSENSRSLVQRLIYGPSKVLQTSEDEALDSILNELDSVGLIHMTGEKFQVDIEVTRSLRACMPSTDELPEDRRSIQRLLKFASDLLSDYGSKKDDSSCEAQGNLSQVHTILRRCASEADHAKACADTWAQLGEVYQRNRMLEFASGSFAQSVSVRKEHGIPPDNKALVRLAECYIERGLPKRAVKILRKATKATPELGDMSADQLGYLKALLTLALAEYASGDAARAEHAFRQAMRFYNWYQEPIIAVEKVDILERFGRAALRTVGPKIAAEYFKGAYTECQCGASIEYRAERGILRQLISSYLAINDIASAEECAHYLRDLSRDVEHHSVEDSNLLANILIRSGNGALAEEVLREALSHTEESENISPLTIGQLKFNLHLVIAENGSAKEARTLLEDAIITFRSILGEQHNLTLFATRTRNAFQTRLRSATT